MWIFWAYEAEFLAGLPCNMLSPIESLILKEFDFQLTALFKPIELEIHLPDIAHMMAA